MKTTRVWALATLALLVMAFSAGTGGVAGAEPGWTSAATATVHPGVQTVSESGQCTANFVFYDDVSLYIGQAAHCTGTGAANQTNGCQSGVLPLGTPVTISGASQPGTVVYNSWNTMQAVGETNQNACLGNDFALIKLHPADHGKVNPSIPFWGGPTGLDPSSSLGEVVYGYGNSSLRLGITTLSPKTGLATGQQLGGWSHVVYTATPGIPGDSGSAYLGSAGGALGILSTLQVLPIPGANSVSDLSRALTYMRANTDLDAVTLANGTEMFSALL